ncbi:hypothetical protein Phum_PHUM399840 [Pediculus humanus corporis]|uniref:Uncharacterized protein n=1 Tax=Pediculus humanus subsp. corporis TaxID=121224 RepID=E0VRL2_PEDHC|nr:uncharacterized protein Phum_PHUM399840 [Pediculus humanus corporis]EEB16018.1 hypothetical protein Phum_PHUM399840 [Pediculus humanus corporis]
MDATRCLDDIDPDFKYTDANVSHSWIINYPDKLKPSPETLKISSKNETYTVPINRIPSTKGKRKKIMEAFFRKLITDETLAKYGMENDIVIEPYETDYSEHYKNPDDLPLPGENLSKNEKDKLIKDKSCSKKEVSKLEKIDELKLKYPLYLSTPLTFVSQITGKNNFRRSTPKTDEW